GKDTSPMTTDVNPEETLTFKTNDIFQNMHTLLTPPNENETESIITLLFKILHKQRSNDFIGIINNISIQLKTSNCKNISRIGDGYYFLTNILHLSSQMNEQCRLIIEQEIEKLK
ncbi:unnamed protein product, partial [Adineta steineri]